MKTAAMTILVMLSLGNAFASDRSEVSQAKSCIYQLHRNSVGEDLKLIKVFKSIMAEKGYVHAPMRTSENDVDYVLYLNFEEHAFNNSVTVELEDAREDDYVVTRTVFGGMGRVALRIGSLGFYSDQRGINMFRKALNKLPSCDQFDEVAGAERL